MLALETLTGHSKITSEGVDRVFKSSRSILLYEKMTDPSHPVGPKDGIKKTERLESEESIGEHGNSIRSA